MLYKIINNIVLLPSTQVTRMEPSCYDLRNFNNQRINPLFCRTDTYKYSFYPQSIKLWNNLPLQIADSSSFTSFQNFLHKYIV